MDAIFALLALILGCRMCACVPEQVSVQYSLQEEAGSRGHLVGDLKANTDISSRFSAEDLSEIHFHFLSEAPDLLEVEESTGKIRTSGRVDRDQLCPSANICQIQFDLATQPAQLFLIVKVTVNILDINDNGPQFDVSDVTKRLSESMKVGDRIPLAEVRDPDGPQFTTTRYVLDPVKTTDQFRISVTSLDQSVAIYLILETELNREVTEDFHFKVVVYDGGSPSRTASLEVTILVEDINDNSPVFLGSPYEAVVPEHAPRGYPVIQVHAEDPDCGPSGHVTYRLSEESLAEHGESFSVDPQSGEVVVTGDLDHEVQRVITLSVEAVDGGPGPLTARTLLTVRLQDVNDHPPTVTVNTLQGPGLTRLTLPENATLGTFVARVSVADRDSGRNGNVNCSMDDASFELQPFGAEFLVTSSAPLDRERQAEVTLSVICSDLGSPPQTTVTEIHVSLGDINDNSPSFLKSSYYRQVAENNPRGALLLQVSAQDRDDGLNGQVVYSIHGNADKVFQVDPVTGVVTAIVSLDREEAAQYVVSLVASDRGTPTRTATAELIVMVTDVNDEAPAFSQEAYSFGVYENEAAGAEVGRVNAQDADSSLYNIFTYSIQQWRPIDANTPTGAGNPGDEPFRLSDTTGRLVTSRILDRETHSGYELVVVAADVAEAALSSTATVSVYVLDRNDNRPEFRFPGSANRSLSVSPWAAVGLEVGRLEADDPDLGEAGRVRFSLSAASHPGLFRVEGDSGAVVVAAPLTALHNVTVLLTLAATDGGHPPLSSTRTLYVTVNATAATPDDGDLVSNVVIVISVACLSGVVIVALALAIVVLLRQQRLRRRRLSWCHLSVSSTSPNAASTEKEPPAEQTPSLPLKPVQSRPPTDNPAPSSMKNHVAQTAPDYHTTKYVTDEVDYVTVKPGVHLAMEKSRDWLRTYHDSKKSSDKEIASHRAASRDHGQGHDSDKGHSAHPMDSDSLTSGGGSNADSGRGPSEQDDLGARPADLARGEVSRRQTCQVAHAGLGRRAERTDDVIGPTVTPPRPPKPRRTHSFTCDTLPRREREHQEQEMGRGTGDVTSGDISNGYLRHSFHSRVASRKQAPLSTYGLRPDNGILYRTKDPLCSQGGVPPAGSRDDYCPRHGILRTSHRRLDDVSHLHPASHAIHGLSNHVSRPHKNVSFENPGVNQGQTYYLDVSPHGNYGNTPPANCKNGDKLSVHHNSNLDSSYGPPGTLGPGDNEPAGTTGVILWPPPGSATVI